MEAQLSPWLLGRLSSVSSTPCGVLRTVCRRLLGRRLQGGETFPRRTAASAPECWGDLSKEHPWTRPPPGGASWRMPPHLVVIEKSVLHKKGTFLPSRSFEAWGWADGHHARLCVLRTPAARLRAFRSCRGLSAPERPGCAPDALPRACLSKCGRLLAS